MGVPPQFQVRVILAGSPAVADILGTEATTKLALEMLRVIDGDDRLAVAMSTQNLVSNEILRALTSVLENIDVPLTSAMIDGVGQAAA